MKYWVIEKKKKNEMEKKWFNFDKEKLNKTKWIKLNWNIYYSIMMKKNETKWTKMKRNESKWNELKWNINYSIMMKKNELKWIKMN